MTIENSFNIKTVTKEAEDKITSIVLSIMLLTVLAYTTGIPADRAEADCTRVLTAFLESNYQRKN